MDHFIINRIGVRKKPTNIALFLFEGIFKTNAMVISNDESCLFPLVCRANHSCVPNCTYTWHSDTAQQVAVHLIQIYHSCIPNCAYNWNTDTAQHVAVHVIQMYHSCVPNCTYTWNSDTAQQVAVQDCDYD